MPNGSKSLKIAARFLPDAGLEPGEASPKDPRSSALVRSATEASLRTLVEKATYEPRAPHFVGYVPDGVHFGWRNGFRQIDSGHVSSHFELFENHFFFSTNFGSRAFGLPFWRLAGPFQLLSNVLYDLLSVARWISRRLSKNTFPRYNFGRFSDSRAFSIRFGRLASSSQMLIDVLYNLFSVAVLLVRCR